jgi:hypothetical protein
MKRREIALFSFAYIVLVSLSRDADAQVSNRSLLPPRQTNIDKNFANLAYWADDSAYGKWVYPRPSVSIGGGSSIFQLVQYGNDTDSTSGRIKVDYELKYDGGVILITAGIGSPKVHSFIIGTLFAGGQMCQLTGTNEDFTAADGTAKYVIACQPTGSGTYSTNVQAGPYTNLDSDGTMLDCSGSASSVYAGGICTIYLEDGTQASFQMPSSMPTSNIFMSSSMNVAWLTPTQITRPDGEIITITGNGATSSLGYKIFKQANGLSPGNYDLVAVNSSVTNCQDYSSCINAPSAQRMYAANISGAGTDDVQSSIMKNGILAYTIRQQYIAPVGGADVPEGLNSISYPSGRKIEATNHGTGCVWNPTYGFATCSGTYSIVTRGGQSYRYQWTEDRSSGRLIERLRIDNPDSTSKFYSTSDGLISDSIDELNRPEVFLYTGFNYWSASPVVSAFYHKDTSNYAVSNNMVSQTSATTSAGATTYGYTRGVLTDAVEYPTDGSSSLSLGSNTLAASCTLATMKTCNRPISTTDARGNATDFVYSDTHGGVLTETAPADQSGVRAEKRFSYSQLYPKVLNGSGQLVNSTPVWRLTSVSECTVATAANPASCVGTKDERVTTYAYNDNNLRLTSETVAAGDGSASRTTSYSYNSAGDVTSVDGPRTDVDDRTYTTYDALRRKLYEIGADPDGGGGPLPRQIVHHVYDVDGNETRTEYGTGSATDGSDFALLHFKRMTYDATSGLLSKVEEVKP